MRNPLRFPLPLLLLSVMPLFVGCASHPSKLDAGFGESVRQARAVQVVYPDRRTPVGEPMGVDARAATSSIEVYQESFKTPQKTFGILGIGGGLGTTAQ